MPGQEPFEWGVRPAIRNVRGEVARFNQDCLLKGPESLIDSGDLHIKDYPRVKAAVDLYRLVSVNLAPLERLRNFWLVGSSGVGKTLASRAMSGGDHYEKDPGTEWFTGYSGQEFIIIDDFEPYHIKQSSLLKRVADHNPVNVRVHCGLVAIRPRTVIVTSNYSIDEIWGHDPRCQAAIERRFKQFEVLKDRWNIVPPVQSRLAGNAPGFRGRTTSPRPIYH